MGLNKFNKKPLHTQVFSVDIARRGIVTVTLSDSVRDWLGESLSNLG